ncbi:MAG: hypothetical protein AB7O88_25835 [Reyranellaceae bacterium]
MIGGSRGAALAVLLCTLCAGATCARSLKLVEGDPERCSTYAELMTHPVIGRYQHNWRPAAQFGRHLFEGYGSLVIPSTASAVALLVVKSPREAPVLRSEVLTFRFTAHPGGISGAARTYRSLTECRTADRNACVLDDDRLGAKFKLPLLDATRVVPRYKAMVFGNSYYFYHFKDRYWLTISPLGFDGHRQFGFALASPDAVAAGRIGALFEFGCQFDTAF